MLCLQADACQCQVRTLERSAGSAHLARNTGASRAESYRNGGRLLIEHQDEPLSQFAIAFEPDAIHPARVGEPRLFENRVASPPPFLLDVGAVEWRLAFRVDPYTRRKRPPRGPQPLTQRAAF